MGEEQGARTDARRSRRRFAAGMAAADHDDVISRSWRGSIRASLFQGNRPLARTALGPSLTLGPLAARNDRRTTLPLAAIISPAVRTAALTCRYRNPGRRHRAIPRHRPGPVMRPIARKRQAQIFRKQFGLIVRRVEAMAQRSKRLAQRPGDGAAASGQGFRPLFPAVPPPSRSGFRSDDPEPSPLFSDSESPSCF